MKLQRRLDNASWIDEDRKSEFIARAVARDAEIAQYTKQVPKTEQEIRDILTTGATIPYGQDWYAELRDANAQPCPRPERRQWDYPNGRLLDCSCTVYYQGQVMSASLGSTCQECYDRMSN